MNPEQAAEAIIRYLQIRNPIEIEVDSIAALRNVFVQEGDIVGAEARLVRLGDKGLVTLSSRITNQGRRRFSIGHELGHFELHKLSGLLSCTNDDMNDWFNRNRKETEANRFSAELLMPTFLFSPRCKGIPGMKLLKTLMEEFQTSLTATAIKYIQVTHEPCALIYCKDGKINWTTKKKDDFPYYLPANGQLVHGYSYAHDAFQGKSIPEDGGLVPAYAWIDGRRIDPDAEIKECTCYFPSYNESLTLLWINDEIER